MGQSHTRMGAVHVGPISRTGMLDALALPCLCHLVVVQLSPPPPQQEQKKQEQPEKGQEHPLKPPPHITMASLDASEYEPAGFPLRRLLCFVGITAGYMGLVSPGWGGSLLGGAGRAGNSRGSDRLTPPQRCGNRMTLAPNLIAPHAYC